MYFWGVRRAWKENVLCILRCLFGMVRERFVYFPGVYRAG